MSDSLKPITINSMMKSIELDFDQTYPLIQMACKANELADKIVSRILMADEIVLRECLRVYLGRLPVLDDYKSVIMATYTKPPEINFFGQVQLHHEGFLREYFISDGKEKPVRLFGSSDNCVEIHLDLITFNEDQLVEIHGKVEDCLSADKFHEYEKYKANPDARD